MSAYEIKIPTFYLKINEFHAFFTSGWKFFDLKIPICLLWAVLKAFNGYNYASRDAQYKTGKKNLDNSRFKK